MMLNTAGIAALPVGAGALLGSMPAHALGSTAASPWWVWPIALFVVGIVLGIVAVPAGIGGGTLFVPIVGGFFPFHLDFVRAAGTLVALASALGAGPFLLRGGLAHLRLALPLAATAALGSIAGASLGMALPAAVIETALGAVVLGIVGLMSVSRRSEFPRVRADALAGRWGLAGRLPDLASGRHVDWTVHRTAPAMALFAAIGVMGGLFGIGAGWANVPAINLLMGAPLKVAAGTSSLVLSLSSASAAWVYLNRGAVLPLVVVPAMAGMLLGARLGARLLGALNAAAVRRLVIAVLLFAGSRSLLKGLGLWT